MLVNYLLSGKTVATPYGVVVFNAQGESNDLPEAHQKELASKVISYSYVEDKKQAPEKPKEEDKVNTPEEEESPVEAPKDVKKAPAKKAPVKKTPAKKETTKK